MSSNVKWESGHTKKGGLRELEDINMILGWDGVEKTISGQGTASVTLLLL